MDAFQLDKFRAIPLGKLPAGNALPYQMAALNGLAEGMGRRGGC